MAFLYPYFLFALSAIAIPIIIHLFSFRSYKPVYFSSLQFLKSIKQETQSRTQLKHLLILLSRILAIVALVIAFAQPYIPVAQKIDASTNEVVTIYIDNSFSMDSESKYGKLLEVSKTKARAIANAYRGTTNFLLITNDFDEQHQHLVNREQLLDFLNKVTISPTVRQLSEIFVRENDFMNQNTNGNKQKNTLFILSDFQRTSCDFKNVAKYITQNNVAQEVELVPLATQATNNLYIDSCWFETPNRKLNQAEKLFVRVVNKSNESYNNIPIKLTINDTLKSMGSFNVTANASQNIELTYTNTQIGVLNGKIEITDYPIVYDNAFYFSYSLSNNINLLSISHKGEDNHVKALFDEDAYFKVSYFSEDNIKTSEFANYQTIILSDAKSLATGVQQEIANFVSNGGTLIFFPSADGDVMAYNQLLGKFSANLITNLDTARTRISKINYQNQIYANVFKKVEDNMDLPILFKHFKFSNLTQTNEIEILKAENGDRIFTELPYKSGKVYISAIPLDIKCSNFTKHPIFVPTLYNTALYSQNSNHIFYIIGKDETVEIRNAQMQDNKPFHIMNRSGKYDFIPYHSSDIAGSTIRLSMKNNIKEADNYYVMLDNKVIKGASFNYNRSESDLTYYKESEISQLITELSLKGFSVVDNSSIVRFGSSLKEINNGKQYWRVFLILALLFIGAEIALIRFWK